MNGKEYLASAIEKVEQVVSDLKSSDKVDGDLLEGLAKACETLGSFKGKATFRTKAGTSIAIPVFEAAERLEEAWEEDDLEDVEEGIEAFVEAVATLGGALKDRTVIMT